MVSFSLHRHCDQTIGGHWQSPGIHGRNQQFLIIFIILLFWMFSPFKHKPSQYKMMDEGEMIGIQGYHLKFLGLVPPSLIPLNKKISLPTTAGRATADCCPACTKAMQSG